MSESVVAESGATDARRAGSTRPYARLRGPLGTAILLFGVSAFIRLALATQLAFPPLGDAAYYIGVAQSLYHGRGFTIGNVWNYQPAPPAVAGPSNSYWGPLTSIVEWPSLLLFGDHLLAALLPDILAGALLVALTYWWGRRAFTLWLTTSANDVAHAARAAHWLALGAAILMAVNAEFVYQSVSGDSTMLYGVLGFSAIVIWERTLSGGTADGRASQRSRRWSWQGATPGAWITGVLLGCAYLTRGSAIFLLAGVGGWWCWQMAHRARRTATIPAGYLVGAAAAALLGAGLVVAPWLVRQQLAFGHLFTSEAMQNALAFSLEDFSAYGAPPTLTAYLGHGAGALLALRISAFTDILRHVSDYAFYPTALPALVGLVLLARRVGAAALGLLNVLLLVVGFTLLFPAVSLFGGYYHSLASVAPFLAWGELTLIYVAARWARQQLPLHVSLAPALLAIAVLLQVALLAFAVPAVAATARNDQRTFADATRWLRAHHAQVVMATESTSLYYASGIPTIELPAAQSPDVAYACARRYGAEYLVILRPAGQYPRILDERHDPRFVLVAQTAEYQVFRIVA
ncbi:MAG TPA: hypothetical protein VGN32_15440 [Ktedonobacterales bacterium]|nr:hypothetical protein [Ktedonobacterales bacterium]